MASAGEDSRTKTAAAAAVSVPRRHLSDQLSDSYTFSTPTASSSPSPFRRFSQLSSESIPGPMLDSQSSFSSTSSYESFVQFEPPAAQTMMAQGQPVGAGAGYDPTRLSASMFQTNPAQWSMVSNESLFSIKLNHSGDVGDLYYDAAGREETKLPTVPEVPLPSRGLCEIGSGQCNLASPTPLAAEPEKGEEKTNAPNADAEGGCCAPWLRSMWWPRCICSGCNCRRSFCGT